MSIGATERSDAAFALERAAGKRYLNAWNDMETTTHADVLALFDRAIAARRKEIAST